MVSDTYLIYVVGAAIMAKLTGYELLWVLCD